MSGVGFSTGVFGLFEAETFLSAIKPLSVKTLELSALRLPELSSVIGLLSDIDIKSFDYLSVHAPSRFEPQEEQDIIQAMQVVADMSCPFVMHPDTITDFPRWNEFGDLLIIENMDQRKETGRTVEELEFYFDRLPKARFCLDLAHARQIDTSMTEAYRMLSAFGDRLAQVHISDINGEGVHHRVTYEAALAYGSIVSWLDVNVPVLIESPLDVDEMSNEIEAVRIALQRYEGNGTDTAASMCDAWMALKSNHS